jgi:hypothetical protein
MTAADLLAKARTWTRPATPARSKLAYASVDPTIDYLADQDWPAVRIKDAIAQEKKLTEAEARRLYYHITKRLAKRRPA